MDKPISKAGFIKFKDTYLTLTHYKEPLTKIKGGFGYMGCLLGTIDGTKVQCAICGKLYSELGKHVEQKHNITVRQYKEKFGLAYKTSLISEDIREKRKINTLKWIKKMEQKHGIDWRQKLINASKKGSLNNKKGRFQPKLTLETKNKRGTCPDQLLEKIKEVKERLGHTPSKNDFIRETGGQRYVHLIYKTFGSWLNAIKVLNLTPKKNRGNTSSRRIGNGRKPSYNEEELLEYLVIFHKDHKKIPTETDCRRGLIPPAETYKRHFGSLPKARERAQIYGKPTRFGVINV